MLKRRMTLHKIQSDHIKKITVKSMAYSRMDEAALQLHGLRPY